MTRSGYEVRGLNISQPLKSLGELNSIDVIPHAHSERVAVNEKGPSLELDFETP